jgi:hypothetical protein
VGAAAGGAHALTTPMVAIPVRALWAYRLGYRTRRRMLVKLLRRGVAVGALSAQNNDSYPLANGKQQFRSWAIAQQDGPDLSRRGLILPIQILCPTHLSIFFIFLFFIQFAKL